MMKPVNLMLLGLSFALSTATPILADTPSMAPASSSIEGVWRSVDDKTGYAKSLIKIERASDGSYGGTIIKVLSHPGYTPQVYCQDCPAPYTGKPIEGLHILWGLKADTSDKTAYGGGNILDPLSGRIYSAKISLEPGGKKLDLRGYLGFSLLGRSQTWTREP